MALTKAQLRELARTRPENGNRVRAARKILNLSQLAMQAESGIDQRYISKVESGGTNDVTVTSASRFAEFFGAPIEVLFPVGQEAVAS
jgi:transcriptional regulator with XRE-family HTH domain